MAERRSGASAGESPPGPERPGWPLLVAGGLVYAGRRLLTLLDAAPEPDD